MPSTIQTKQTPILPVACDFGWYYSSGQRLPEVTYSVDGNSYPPGNTMTVGSQTLSTGGTSVLVASTANFESAGSVVFYGGALPNQRTTCSYTVTDSTHLQCTGGSGTFADGTPVFDPRFYVDATPLRQIITFDAVDSLSLGLPTVQVPSGVTIVSYRWDFGNGLIGVGPTATTTYTYSQPVASIQTSLTIYDSLGRRSSCAHHLNQQSLSAIYRGSRFVAH